MKNSHLVNYVLLIVSMIFWGISWPLAKILVPLATSFQIGFFRFIIASFVYIVFYFIKFRNNLKVYTWKSIYQFFVLGLLGIFGYGILFLTAMRFTTSAQGAVLAGVQPTIITLLSRLIHKERLEPKWRYWGLLFSFAGVLMIIGIAPFIEFNSQHVIGNIIVLGAFFCFAGYSVLGKTVMQTHTSYETTTWATVLGAFMFGGAAIIENQWDQLQWNSWIFWISIIIMALFVTVISFLCYFVAIKNLGTTKSGIFINLVPVFGTLFSVILLGESISWTLWLGLLLISLGIAFINFPIDFNLKAKLNEKKRKWKVNFG
ncbi:MAG: DMT family transporter [Candidatus Lokiarchaeota archaeon]|nr:DMT family transporter [Candidatus Lokiarchaeota archaeon]